jgi:hypothetical protein
MVRRAVAPPRPKLAGEMETALMKADSRASSVSIWLASLASDASIFLLI